MNFTIGTADLVKALKRVEKVAPPKPPNPILTHVLIRASENVVYFSTTDNELSITTESEATIVEDGAVAVPVKHLLEIASHITDAETRLMLESNHVFVSAGYFKTRVQAMNPADFPQLPVYAGNGSLVSGPLLRSMIRKVKCAMSDNPQRYFLHGAQLILSPDKKTMFLVTTDGFRLAITSGEYTGTMAHEGVLISAKAIEALLLDDDEEDLSFLSNENHLFFVSEHATIAATQIAGKFPAWQTIIPRENTLILTVPRDAWLYAIKRVALVAGELKTVTIKIEPGFMILHTVSPTLGDASERIAVEYAGEPITVTTKWPYLVDFLESAEHGAIDFRLKDARERAILNDGPNHMQVVVLMAK